MMEIFHTEEGPDTGGLFKKALGFMERVFGFDGFRPGQEEILCSVLDGSDTLIIMPTGGGKSLCYQLPAFIRPGMTLVVSPLISLMKDQVDGLRVLDLPAVAVHSLMTLKEQEEALGRIGSGRAKIAYVSPERLNNQRFLRALKETQISMVAVDEAHCISQWGHDFRPDYLRVGHALRLAGRPQVIALTATATERVRGDIIHHLGMRSPRVFVTGFDRRNLYWEVLRVGNEKEKLDRIKERLARKAGAAIVYAGTRKGVEGIVKNLGEQGIRAAPYHAGMEKARRAGVQEAFMAGRTDLVVATNAFGMGIDRPDIRMVVHHDFPGSIEAYYQESGRAGRDGEPATCLLLYSPADRRLQEFFIETRYPSRETIFAVYDRIRSRPEDLLWLTYREIGSAGQEKIQELAVASSIRILEEAGAVARLRRMDNLAELYLRHRPEEILKGLPGRAKMKRQILTALCGMFGEEELKEGIRFLPDELARELDSPVEALRRTLAEMSASGEVDYIPPFRGRGLRVMKRVSPKALDIDFEDLRLRKAADLEKLDRVVAYATSRDCRRYFLLRYFGESFRGDRCGACDLCVRHDEMGVPPGEGRAEPILAIQLLSGVARMKGRFGLGMTAKVLQGSRDRMISQFGLHRLSTYGLLSRWGQDRIQQWLKELLAMGCLVVRRIPMGKRIYPVLELTDRGYRVMGGKEEVRLPFPKEGKGVSAVVVHRSTEAREEAFQRLRELRSRIAKEEGLPPYCVFHDRTLREMARSLPGSAEELLSVPGVGEITLRKYGRAFLEVLKELRAGALVEGPPSREIPQG